MQITEKKYFSDYHKQIGHKIDSLIERFDFNAHAIDLGYATQAAAVYSSNIEGNTVDLNCNTQNFTGGICNTAQ